MSRTQKIYEELKTLTNISGINIFEITSQIDHFTINDEFDKIEELLDSCEENLLRAIDLRSNLFAKSNFILKTVETLDLVREKLDRNEFPVSYKASQITMLFIEELIGQFQSIDSNLEVSRHFQPIKINCETSILAAFFDLMNDSGHIKTSKYRIAKLFAENFEDKSGEPVKMDSLNQMMMKGFSENIYNKLKDIILE